MNKRGFTLVEVIVVISLLGLVVIISSTNILGGSTRAKEKMLETKIKNIEKAAVLYGQDFRHKINVLSTNNYTQYPLCFKNNGTTHISNCYYYSNNSNTPSTITVGFLANPGNDSEGNAIEPYISYDEGNIIKNPVDESKNMKDCEIQIYQKYGKIYADYIETIEGNNEYNKKCWK